MDQQTISALLDAVHRRHSVRFFLPDPLPDAVLAEADAFIRTLETPFAHTTEIRRFRAEPGKKLYNNGVNGPDNLAVLAQTDPVSLAKAGFCGQLAVLKLTSLGVNTCWFGHYKLTELARYLGAELASPERVRETTWRMGYGCGRTEHGEERVVCCIACGTAKPDAHRLVDIVAGKRGAGRKPLDQLLETSAERTALSAGVLRALDAARLAPSAANSQMWRFGISDGGKTITIAKPVGYRHFKWEHPDVDIGICASHLWLGLLAENQMPRVEVVQDADRALWRFHL